MKIINKYVEHDTKFCASLFDIMKISNLAIFMSIAGVTKTWKVVKSVPDTRGILFKR